MNLEQPSPEELVKEIMRKAIDQIKQIEAGIERLKNPRQVDFVPPGFANPQNPVARRLAIVSQQKLIKDIRQQALEDAAKAIEKLSVEVQLEAFKHIADFAKPPTPFETNRKDATDPRPNRINLAAAYMNTSEKYAADKEKMNSKQDSLMGKLHNTKTQNRYASNAEKLNNKQKSFIGKINEEKARNNSKTQVSPQQEVNRSGKIDLGKAYANQTAKLKERAQEITKKSESQNTEKFKGMNMSMRFNMNVAYTNKQKEKDKSMDYEPER